MMRHAFPLCWVLLATIPGWSAEHSISVWEGLEPGSLEIIFGLNSNDWEEGALDERTTPRLSQMVEFVAAPPHRDETIAFLRAIESEPFDDTVRLAYADWLDEENRDTDLAEFIRTQIELTKLDWLNERAMVFAKSARAAALLQENAARWMGPLLHWQRSPTRYTVRRGFVEGVSIPIWHPHGERERLPIRITRFLVGTHPYPQLLTFRNNVDDALEVPEGDPAYERLGLSYLDRQIPRLRQISAFEFDPYDESDVDAFLANPVFGRRKMLIGRAKRSPSEGNGPQLFIRDEYPHHREMYHHLREVETLVVAATPTCRAFNARAVSALKSLSSLDLYATRASLPYLSANNTTQGDGLGVWRHRLLNLPRQPEVLRIHGHVPEEANAPARTLFNRCLRLLGLGGA